MAKVPSAVEILPTISTTSVRDDRQTLTTDRQTNGQATANSEREREWFTFAKIEIQVFNEEFLFCKIRSNLLITVISFFKCVYCSRPL